MTSLPIFIPLLNNSFQDISFVLFFISSKLDAMLIPTSIQAPNAEITIPAKIKSLKLNVAVCIFMLSCIASSHAPDNSAKWLNIDATIPADTTPPKVPIAAVITFLFIPPITINVKTIITAQVTIDISIAS